MLNQQKLILIRARPFDAFIAARQHGKQELTICAARRASLATAQKLSPAFRKSARNDLIPKLFDKPCLAISLIDLSSHGIDRMYE